MPKSTIVLRYLLPMCCLAAVCLLIVRQEYERSPKRLKHYSGALQAIDYWMQARSYPSNDLPSEGLYRAFQKSREKLPELRVTNAISQWESIGPTNLSGRMISLAINPQNPNTVYAGSASGGLWRSHTGGTGGDWHRVQTGFPVLGVGAVAIHPSDSNIIYIGTGETYFYQQSNGGIIIRTMRGSYGLGILKTTDGGMTWAKSLDWTYQQQRGVQALRINPQNPRTVWAATSDGIFRTLDAGATWEQILPLLMGTDILIHPADTNKMIISVGNVAVGNAIFRSSDGGATWQSVAPISFQGKALLDFYYSNPDLVYASIGDQVESGVGSLWKSTNFGLTWTKLQQYNTTAQLFGVQGWYSHFVAIHPFDSNQVVHAGVPAMKSLNGGASFAGTSGSYSDHHACAYLPTDPNVLYVANDDGIYKSTNFGATYFKASGGLETGQFYNGFSNSSTDSNLAIGQVQDHIPGYIYFGNKAWGRSVVDETGWTAIDPTNDNIMYAMFRFGGNVFKSTDRGHSFISLSPAGLFGWPAWNSPLVLSPSNPNILYFGRSPVFKSTNAGATWSVTNGGQMLDPNPSLSMAISFTDPDRVYVGKGPVPPTGVPAKLYRTTNGGTTWDDITGTTPDRYPIDMAVDPNNDQVVYAAFGGFGTGHLFKSTNGGDGWSDVTGTLPDIPTTAIVVDPLNSNFVYVGNDLGVYVSTNAGASWNSFVEGFPEAAIIADLTISPSNRMLRATTHGNGVFQRPLPDAFPFLSIVAPSGGEAWKAGTTKRISWAQAFAGSLRIEYSYDDGTSWLPVASGVPAASKGFDWLVPKTLTTQALVRIVDESNESLVTESATTFAIYFTGNIFSVDNGWNIVSLPREVVDGRKSSVFPGSITSAFAFDGSYTAEETLVAGRGYWLKYGAGSVISIEGDSLVDDTISLVDGWNLIGTLSTPLPTAAVQSSSSGLLGSEFFEYNKGYTSTDTLYPGKGYWVKSNGNGEIYLSTSASVPVQQTHPKTLVHQTQPNGLMISDGSGNQQRLEFSSSYSASLNELPPVPPHNVFDVRFVTNTVVMSIDKDGEQQIQLQGYELPLTLQWNVDDGRSYHLSIDGRIIAIAGSGTTVIERFESGTMTLQTASQNILPTEYALRQNYPNPFNPTTRISYSLPEAGNVSVTILGVDGRKIATLVDRVQDAGEYTLEWDGGGFASGVYFYRYEAVSAAQPARKFASVRKMLLVR